MSPPNPNGSSVPRSGCTGPRTASGKDRSSANRTRHGLCGSALVLPGESVRAYRRHQAAWSVTLPSTTEAEALVVAQIADAAWRLQRLLRLEHEHHLRLVEDAMKKTSSFRSHGLALRALPAVNSLIDVAGQAAQLEPFPSEESQLRPLLAGARGTVSLVADVDELPTALLKRLERAMSDLEDAANRDEATGAQVSTLVRAALDVQGSLSSQVKTGKEVLDDLRKRLAAEVVPGEGREGRRLARYRAEIERSQARMLGVLGQVREQRKAARKAAKEGTQVGVRLRVVK